jgi:endo-1,4-beta-xylanase
MSTTRRLSRRSFLTAAASTVGAGALAYGALLWRSRMATRPLGHRAAARGILYGAAAHYTALSSDSLFATHIAEECGVLVPGVDLKWMALRPAPGAFDFTRADWLAAFARDHGLQFRGHTLVWHSSLPGWFVETVNRQNAAQVLQDHITTVVRRYAGQMHSWDVVNEVVNPGPERKDGLRESRWLKLLGPDYIDLAFHTAAQADPNALLVYNEHTLESKDPLADAKRATVLQLLEGLRSRGVPIHALGIQSHLAASAKRAAFDATRFRAFLRDVASMGLQILITELDVADHRLPNDLAQRDEIVAQTYQDYLTVALDEPAVIAVVTWGLSDRYTWLASEWPRPDGAPVRPLPLDAQMLRKPAWSALAAAFDRASPRRRS